MLTHTISIYSWPVSLLREMEKWIKNFIWSGDVQKRKLVTVAWKKVCVSYEDGGSRVEVSSYLKCCLQSKDLLGAISIRRAMGACYQE